MFLFFTGGYRQWVCAAGAVVCAGKLVPQYECRFHARFVSIGRLESKFNIPGFGEVSMSDVDTVELEAGFFGQLVPEEFRGGAGRIPADVVCRSPLRRQWLLCEVKNLWSLAPMFMDYVGSLHSDEFPGIDAVAFRPLPDEMKRFTDGNGGKWVPAGWEAVVLEGHMVA